VSLDPPIRHGHTIHPHLLFHFPKDDTREISLNLLPAIEQKYGNKLQPTMSGASFKLVKRIFKVLTEKKVTLPGNFKSHNGSPAIKCSLRANDGHLYPMEKGFFFLHKPPIHIPFNSIASIEFARVSRGTTTSSNRTFDINIMLKNSTTHTFTNIQRNEYLNLFNFITAKKLRILGTRDFEDESSTRSRLNAITGAGAGADDDEEEEDDADFVAVEEEDVPEEFDSGSEDEEKSFKESSFPDGEEHESDVEQPKKSANQKTKKKKEENQDEFIAPKEKHEKGKGVATAGRSDSKSTKQQSNKGEVIKENSQGRKEKSQAITTQPKKDKSSSSHPSSNVLGSKHSEKRPTNENENDKSKKRKT